ncbi:putative pheophorbide a oxygenase [Helianthus annuus]|nr:putative pheophorbide a oxygenase [Helianthus annuus]
MPVCDLDKRAPHGKKVLDDRCPHRLAPLSEGRIDQWGRLQCVYHGWCFGGSGDCKFIPQAPPDGPLVNDFTCDFISNNFILTKCVQVHTSQKACVSVYPSTVHNGIVWF